MNILAKADFVEALRDGKNLLLIFSSRAKVRQAFKEIGGMGRPEFDFMNLVYGVYHIGTVNDGRVILISESDILPFEPYSLRGYKFNLIILETESVIDTTILDDLRQNYAAEEVEVVKFS